jgi:hypothetical protein
MGFLDQVSKQLSNAGARAKFEAEKLQRTLRLQGEITELKSQADLKIAELGARAYDLQRAGQINAPSLAELVTAVDGMRNALLAREEELKAANAEQYFEPGMPTTPPPQSVPITTAPPAAAAPQAEVKYCTSCNFAMPAGAVFCPNCGTKNG